MPVGPSWSIVTVNWSTLSFMKRGKKENAIA